MTLLPITDILGNNTLFLHHPDCQETLSMSVNYYNTIGYNPPWICYYAQLNGILVGSAAFKGKPADGKVEIAYGTFPQHRQQGMAGHICRTLVALARQTDPSVIITARTLPEENYSTRVLIKNGFTLLGTVVDKEDGDVWEWQYTGTAL